MKGEPVAKFADELKSITQAIFEVEDTGIPISVPVGDSTLGRLFNALGETIDDLPNIEDKNIDVAVIAEGELTLADILEKTLCNGKRFPNKEELKKICGIAFLKETISEDSLQINS